MPGVVGVGRAPLAHAPLVFFRIAVLDRLLRAIPTPVTGQLTGVAALGFRAALLIAKVPRVGHIQLLAEPAFTSPSPLPRILCFHGGRSSTKPVRSKRSKCSESRGGRRRKKIFHSKLSEEDPEEETSISGPVNLCHLQNGGGKQSWAKLTVYGNHRIHNFSAYISSNLRDLRAFARVNSSRSSRQDAKIAKECLTQEGR